MQLVNNVIVITFIFLLLVLYIYQKYLEYLLLR